MALALWSPKYATGNELVDGQHRELFRIMNELHESRKLGKGKEQVKKTLAALLAYTIHHFKSEERLMQEHQYPQFAAHKKIHDELTRRVQELAADDKAAPGVLCANISEFLGSWLTQHIDNVDKQMIAFVAAKQAARSPQPVPPPR